MQQVPGECLEPKEFCHEKKLKTGFLGFGDKQTATFKVRMAKTVWAVGEQVNVQVESDNSSCDKAME